MSDHVTKPIDIDRLVAAILRRVGSKNTVSEPAISDAEVSSDESSENVLPDLDTTLLPIDWTTLARNIAKPSVRQKILESMVTNHSGTPQTLRQLALDNDPEGVRQIAHNLRGLAGILGATATQQAAESLENSIRNTRLLDSVLTEHLLVCMDQLLVEIKSHLAATS
jgi:HPt (histidine-containing phosphotransfer) domain-containing protein